MEQMNRNSHRTLIDRLRVWAKGFDTDWGNASEGSAMIHEAIEALERQCGPEDADTKMLDWAEKHRCTIYKSETGTHWTVVDETAKTRQGSVASTLREAICSARSSPQTGAKGDLPLGSAV